MLKEFKEFAMKGNMLDMAVGIILGAAFGTIVKSLVDDIFMPIIGYITGGIDFVSPGDDMEIDGNFSSSAVKDMISSRHFQGELQGFSFRIITNDPVEDVNQALGVTVSSAP